MNSLRNKDSYQKQVYDFIKDMYVVCPSCKSKAIILIPESGYIHKKAVKLTCSACGYNKRYDEKPDEILHASKNKIITGKYVIIGGAIDPYFHIPLWLTIDCCDNILWAYNDEHLNFLQTHVEAKLRERSILDMKNKSLSSRLPKWMTSKKNRQAVLKAITLLKQK
jgi:DNA-directed RNA polymerase subunit RPC12/RpoP